MKKIGLYIHIPFCNTKCPYCDFYSARTTIESIDNYVFNLNNRINSFNSYNYNAETVYIGGGTPSILGTERILSMLNCIYNSFGNNSVETTLEVNPESAVLLDFKALKNQGVNRISMGLQSANEGELISLGRRHSIYDVEKTVYRIRESGIENISLDLMLGIIGQTTDSLLNSIDFCKKLDVEHISAYILSIEKGTLYYKNRNTLNLPDDDTVCDMYELLEEKLNSYGYTHYEISNFAKKGFESKHNLKYWNLEEYLGIGSSAHSFIDKKRFYYSRSLKGFYDNRIIQDGTGGDEDEFVSLALRLSTGLSFKKFKGYFGYDLPKHYLENAQRLQNTDLLILDKEGIRLTEKGFLCSNSVIVEIIM